jgi:hypothetical protein
MRNTSKQSQNLNELKPTQCLKDNDLVNSDPSIAVINDPEELSKFLADEEKTLTGRES